ncbi:MAG: hypothetical protein J6L69_06780 [Lachnospiraceae bacterium]|nr:hypothetical protein [Lachnospiraceae bacterium]
MREGQELVKNMEFLVKELEKEWEQSGVTKAKVVLEVDDIAEVNEVISRKISKTQESIENDTMTFTQNMHLVKENYILLRLLKKIVKKEEKAMNIGVDYEISIAMDKEELKLYKTMFEPRIEE